MVDINPRNDPRTIQGKKEGYSGCRHCGGTWNWRVPFKVAISAMRGCLIICQDCAKGMAVDQITVYMEQLIDEWNQQPEIEDPGREHWLEFGITCIQRWHDNGRKEEDPQGWWVEVGSGRVRK